MSANPVLEPSPSQTAGLLYERHYERVFGYCLYKLGDRQEAEDAAQTTFLWALRGLERGIEPRLEANWLFTIAQNACRARIRTRGRRRQREVLSDPQVLQSIAPGHAGARDELVGLDDALEDIPELQRRAILLREWRGLSYKEIAAELDLTDAAVETLIFRARRSLASRLENPTLRPAKRTKAMTALNLGSFASAFKSLLGLGSGAKLGLAAAVATLAIGLGVPGDTGRPSAPASKSFTPAVLPVDAPPAKLPPERIVAPSSSEPGHETKPSAAGTSAPTTQTAAQAQALDDAVTSTVASLPLDETVAPVKAKVDEVLDSVTAALPLEPQP